MPVGYLPHVVAVMDGTSIVVMLRQERLAEQTGCYVYVCHISAEDAILQQATYARYDWRDVTKMKSHCRTVTTPLREWSSLLRRAVGHWQSSTTPRRCYWSHIADIMRRNATVSLNGIRPRRDNEYYHTDDVGCHTSSIVTA